MVRRTPAPACSTGARRPRPQEIERRRVAWVVEYTGKQEYHLGDVVYETQRRAAAGAQSTSQWAAKQETAAREVLTPYLAPAYERSRRVVEPYLIQVQYASRHFRT